MATKGAARICLGAFAGAHGVRGQVRIRSFTEVPEDLAAYGPLGDEAGQREFRLTLTGRAKDLLLAKVEGVGDRDQAQALKGTRLYVPRAALPPPEEETYYHADLIGLAAEDLEGSPLGQVVAVHNHGAGDLIELGGGPGGRALILPFTKAAVPLVDLAAGRLVADPPDVVEGREDDGKDEPA